MERKDKVFTVFDMQLLLKSLSDLLFIINYTDMPVTWFSLFYVIYQESIIPLPHPHCIYLFLVFFFLCFLIYWTGFQVEKLFVQHLLSIPWTSQLKCPKIMSDSNYVWIEIVSVSLFFFKLICKIIAGDAQTTSVSPTSTHSPDHPNQNRKSFGTAQR